jgi:hypothetical protein
MPDCPKRRRDEFCRVQRCRFNRGDRAACYDDHARTGGWCCIRIDERGKDGGACEREGRPESLNGRGPHDA